jgi:hypothetical protein
MWVFRFEALAENSFVWFRCVLRVVSVESKSDFTSNSLRIIKKFISHSITGFFIGTIGIILAIYFYYSGIKEPKILFLVHPVRTPIVQAGRLSDLSVSFRGKPVNGDLTAVQFAIWNSGRAPVRHEDILKPIVLIANNCPIYEASIRNVSRDIVGFQLITNDIASGHLSFDWKILEHNDGASIQVLYGGSPKFVFREDGGVVVGQNQIPFQMFNVDFTSPMITIVVELICFIVACGFGVGAKIVIKDLSKAIRNRETQKIFESVARLLFCGLVIITFCVVAWLAFFARNGPPFAF